METAFAELPLALFTTLAPMGAGAFIALAACLNAASFDDEAAKKLDRLTLVPMIVVLVGFACSFAHLASPGKAFGVFAGIGSSPLSNEILVGSIFVVVALVFTIMAWTGKLNASSRKVFSAIVAVLAVVFAIFTGMAYMMETIASWNIVAVPLQILGFALLGGAALFALVAALAHVELGAGAKLLSGIAIAGVVIGAIALCAQLAAVSGMSNSATTGAALVESVMLFAVIAVIALIASAVATVMAASGKKVVMMAAVAVALGAVGIFVARLVFYAIQLSVGL